MRLRTDYADPDQQADFYLLHHTSRSAVLIENLIMDTHEDCGLLLSEQGRQSLVGLYVDGITDYLSTL